MEQNLQKQITAGEEAKRIVDSEAFKAAMQRLRDSYSAMLFNTDSDQEDKREYLYQLARMTTDFEAMFLMAMNDGEAAKAELEAEIAGKFT